MTEGSYDAVREKASPVKIAYVFEGGETDFSDGFKPYAISDAEWYAERHGHKAGSATSGDVGN